MTTNTETTSPQSQNTDDNTQTVEDVIGALPPTYQALGQLNLQMLTDFAEAANAIARKVRAQENLETTIQDTIEKSQNPELVQYRAWLEEQKAIEKQAYDDARKVVLDEELKDLDTVDTEKALQEWQSWNAQYKSMVDFMKKNPAADLAPLVEFAPQIENFGNKKGSTGSGTRRPRVAAIRYRAVGTDVWTDSFTKSTSRKDGTVTVNVGFPALASNLKEFTGTKVDPGTLIQEADSAAGTTKWVELEGKPFTFTLSVEPVGDKPHLVEVQVTPKAGDDTDVNDAEGNPA